ncbi:hypothetical protein [Flavobacterium hydatis]|uniref:Uncharacterized protein n=1 Tax=Flavobacterium hydatis TaxID=991 RepID=A0A086AAP8_FLAHY|nr:hypothetical protein [Flavobacterium hydatis]KFF13762.1 hypothetical protein IW20_16915 [Flavobacterium hydatis]
MKYYQIGITADPKIVGVKNGIYQVEINENAIEKDEKFRFFLDFFDYENSHFWKRQDEVNSIKIPSVPAKLLKNAILTDIMGYTPNITFLNELYSDKFINILKEFNIGRYTTFEVKIANNITQLKDNCKKEISIKKKLSAINNDIDSAFSSEDSDIENHYFIPNKIQVYLQINSFDNRFSLLKKSQNSRHFHLPLFIQYHAIKIP